MAVQLEEQIHLNNFEGRREWENLSIDDFRFIIKKVMSEQGKVTVTLYSEGFSNEDIGTLVKMQQQGNGLVTCAIQSLEPEEKEAH